MCQALLVTDCLTLALTRYSVLFPFFTEMEAQRGPVICPWSFRYQVSNPGFELNASDLSARRVSPVCVRV